MPKIGIFMMLVVASACSSSHRAEPCSLTNPCPRGQTCCAGCGGGVCIAAGEDCAGRCDGGASGACGPFASCPGDQFCCTGCGTEGVCVLGLGMCPMPICDAGTGLECGHDVCIDGQVCCPGCPGAGMDAFCAFGGCPDIDCMPPACEECGPALTCCPACPGDPPFCSSSPECPVFDCPPPACECPDDERCCTGCDGEMACVGLDEPCAACPVPECDDARPCADGLYCDRASGCGGPGQCRPLPSDCTADCPTVCGCDGNTYCNACGAASAGVDTAHGGACGADPCAPRAYCACDGACEPLVDLSTGCVCPCDDPFNCSGELCDCSCGGATYLGCATRDRCATPTPSCAPGCRAALGADDCPVCVCPADV